eukprot:1487060-Rhodomonas_salina.1
MGWAKHLKTLGPEDEPNYEVPAECPASMCLGSSGLLPHMTPGSDALAGSLRRLRPWLARAFRLRPTLGPESSTLRSGTWRGNVQNEQAEGRGRSSLLLSRWLWFSGSRAGYRCRSRR